MYFIKRSKGLKLKSIKHSEAIKYYPGFIAEEFKIIDSYMLLESFNSVISFSNHFVTVTYLSKKFKKRLDQINTDIIEFKLRSIELENVKFYSLEEYITNSNNRIVTMRFRCTQAEKEMFLKESKGFKSFSDFIRKRTLNKGSSQVNPVEFIKIIDELSFEIKKIGNNINQFAKYANQIKDTPSENVLRDYNSLLNQYVENEKKLITTFRKVLNS